MRRATSERANELARDGERTKSEWKRLPPRGPVLLYTAGDAPPSARLSVVVVVHTGGKINSRAINGGEGDIPRRIRDRPIFL